MKANELRIGNWVKYLSKHEGLKPYKLGKPHKIIADDIDFIYTHEPEYIEPIPLTEEWLLKFGFEKESINELYLTIDDNNGLFIWVDLNTKHPIAELVDSGDRVIVNHIEYIHELQNLYFALTGKELKKKRIKKSTKGI